MRWWYSAGIIWRNAACPSCLSDSISEDVKRSEAKDGSAFGFGKGFDVSCNVFIFKDAFKLVAVKLLLNCGQDTLKTSSVLQRFSPNLLQSSRTWFWYAKISGVFFGHRIRRDWQTERLAQSSAQPLGEQPMPGCGLAFYEIQLAIVAVANVRLGSALFGTLHNFDD